MKTITLELPEDVFAAVTQSAASHQSLPVWLASQLREWVPVRQAPVLSAAERAAAWERMDQHSGAQSLGYPTGTNNESIDADLAQAYGNKHEDEA